MFYVPHELPLTYELVNMCIIITLVGGHIIVWKEVHAGNDQEKAQSEKISLQKQELEKTKLTIMYLYL